MKRLRIKHRTTYYYHEPVTFGQHVAMMRPREGHDLHIVSGSAEIQPAASIRWMRDIYGNSLALIDFSEPSEVLTVASDVLVDMFDDDAGCPIPRTRRMFPFAYPGDEQLEIIPFRMPSYPREAGAVSEWLAAHVFKPGDLVATGDLLDRLNTAIHQSFSYVSREEPGVQSPSQTLALGSGSCRDYAVFLIEAARCLGFAAAFVTGYILMEEGQHGATHAWAEIYVPGTGWLGFDPTNNKPAGLEHVSAGIARDAHKATPLAGTWSGPASAFDRMEVSVQVFKA